MQRILILMLFVCTSSVEAQLKAKIFIDNDFYKGLEYNDSLAMLLDIKEIQSQWINDGYLYAGLDSIMGDSRDVLVYLHRGDQAKVVLDNKETKMVIADLERTLNTYNNNGYPFASIYLDSIQINNGSLHAKTVVDPGPSIVYDSAYFFQSLTTNKSYIFKLLDIVPGEDFNERDYRRLGDKVNRSSFLTLNRETDLSFTNKKAKVFLDLTESTSSSFQGVIGIQQVPSGQTSLVGNVQLDIRNLFKSGREFFLDWERFAEESQRLSLVYKHPFIFDSRLSPSFGFLLLKQDTTFITRSIHIGAETFVSAKAELSFSYSRTVGSLLSNDLETIRSSGLADFGRSLYSLSLEKGRDRDLNLLKDIVSWQADISAGNKEINRNANLPAEYYDTITFSTNFYQFKGMFAYQKTVLKRQSFFHSLSFGAMVNDELLNNELFRIGGLTTVRGFNEKEFFVREFLLSRAEFRSYFEEGSFAYLFYDQFIYRNQQNQDNPFGIGIGFALATSSGQFTFALAMGRSEFQHVSFSAVKAHFGYISRF